MSNLVSLLGALTAILQAFPLYERVDEVETREFSTDQFFFKVRAQLTGGSKLQVRIYYNRGHIDYAYQLFTEAPLLRWDNKEEFRHLSTYPHHHHNAEGGVSPSPLKGDPLQDIQIVLEEVAKLIAQQ